MHLFSLIRLLVCALMKGCGMWKFEMHFCLYLLSTKLLSLKNLPKTFATFKYAQGTFFQWYITENINPFPPEECYVVRERKNSIMKLWCQRNAGYVTFKVRREKIISRWHFDMLVTYYLRTNIKRHLSQQGKMNPVLTFPNPSFSYFWNKNNSPSMLRFIVWKDWTRFLSSWGGLKIEW